MGNLDPLLAGVKRLALNGILQTLSGGAAIVLNISTGLTVVYNAATGQWDLTNTAGAIAPVYFADLASLSPTATRQIQFIDAYSTQGDGGGGLFAWDSTSTATPDGGTIAKVTTIATGRWLRVYDGPLNVRWYGAKGDSVTDDHAAILLCWTACAAISATSYFPPGTYVSTTSLTLPYNVGIDGYGAEIYFDSATDGLIWSSGSQQVANAHGICGIALQGGGTGGCGLKVNAIQAARVDGAVAVGWVKQGFFFQDTILSELRNSIATACGSSAGGVNGGSGYAAVEVDSANVNGNAGGLGSTTWNWYNNNLSNNTSAPAGLRIDRTGPCVVIGGTSENSGVCIQLASKSESVNGTGHIFISGLDLELPSPTVTHFIDIGYGLTLGTNQDRVNGVTLSNNTLVCDTGAMTYCIRAKYCDGLTVDGNYLGPENTSGTTVANIWLEGTTCTATTARYNRVTNTDPYVQINGVTVPDARAGAPWSQGDPAEVWVPTTTNAAWPGGGASNILATATITPTQTGNIVAEAFSGLIGLGVSTTEVDFILFVNTHGAGLSGAIPMGEFGDLFAGNPSNYSSGVGLAAGLTVGTSYDVMLVLVAQGASNISTGASPLGALHVRESVA